MYANYADLNMKVTLLLIMAILAQIHKLIRASYFTENASVLSRILFKDNELKKMVRMDNFIKVNSYIINPAALTKYLSVFICGLHVHVLIGQSAVVYCAGKPTEKSRVFWIII